MPQRLATKSHIDAHTQTTLLEPFTTRSTTKTTGVDADETGAFFKIDLREYVRVGPIEQNIFLRQPFDKGITLYVYPHIL